MAIKEELEALRDKVKANLKEIKNKIELTNEKANVLGKKVLLRKLWLICVI